MALSTATLPFFSFPPEFRNNVYRRHFAEAYQAIISTHKNASYLDASTLHETVKIFLVCRQMYNETHGLFFIDYLLGTKIQLHTRNSIYASSRLPDPWAQGIHKISLAANDFRQARHILNPIKVALKKALHRTAGYESVAFSSMATGSRNLTQLEALAITTGLAGEAIVLEITEHRSGQTNIDLTGPMAKLDWSIIPLMRYTRTLPRWRSFHVARVQRNASKKAENVIKEAGNSYRVIVLNGDSEDQDIEDLGVFGFVHDAERELRVCLSRPEDMDSEMRAFARQIKMMER